MSNNEANPSTISQNNEMLEIIINLLGRMVFAPESLQAIVMKKKKNPLCYIIAYNLCDGAHTVSEISNTIDLKQATLSPILAKWKEDGILYELTKKGGRYYKRLYKLELPENMKNKKGLKSKLTSEIEGREAEMLMQTHEGEENNVNKGEENSNG